MSPEVPTRPRKGQILALSASGTELRHVIRWRHFYLVPRHGRQVVVGATDEDCGFDRTVTAGAVREILEAAGQMMRGSEGFGLLETWTGLRPETADGLPVIGLAGLAGLYYAFGHYRNGILQAPVTARMLGERVRGRLGTREDEVFSPMRFAGLPGSTPGPETRTGEHV